MSEATSFPTNTALEQVGSWCVRASLVALTVALPEGLVLSRHVPAPLPGLVAALAGLWIPPALVVTALGTVLRRRWPKLRPLRLSWVCAPVVAVGLIVALSAPHDASHGWRYLVALEVALSVSAGWLLAELSPPVPWKKGLAVMGFASVLWLQLFSTRWVDAHRPFAGAMTEWSAWPRVMLRSVLSRIG